MPHRGNPFATFLSSSWASSQPWAPQHTHRHTHTHTHTHTIWSRAWGHLCLRRTGFPGRCAQGPGFSSCVCSHLPTREDPEQPRKFSFTTRSCWDPQLMEKGKRQPQKAQCAHYKLLGSAPASVSRNTGTPFPGILWNPLESQLAQAWITLESRATDRGGFT